MVIDPSTTTGQHGKTVEGNTACCKLSSDGVVDCDQCLQVELRSVTSSLTEPKKDIAAIIMEVLHEAGETGVPKRHLLVSDFTHTQEKT